jgi:hypothetical protein
MNKRVFVVVLLIIIGIAGFGFQYFFVQNKEASGIKVYSDPPSSVFINDKLIGKTPIEAKYSSGEYVLKLIPEDSSSAVSSWQGRVMLSSSLETYVKRELGSSELTSAGDILFLEKISGNEAEINITSMPDAAKIAIDGQEKGISPLYVKDAPTGEHDIAVSSPGYKGRTVRVQVISGYKLNVNFQLALSNIDASATSSASINLTPTPQVTGSGSQEISKPYVLIKDTPTGFLRVRDSASTGGKEVAQVKPGEKYPFIESKEGWLKIAYEKDKEGWISDRYSEKVE